MSKLTLYSTGCPRCTVLIKKLEKKNLQFEEVTDTAVMRAKGIMSVPMLQIDDEKPMEFTVANQWINDQEAQ